MGAGLPGPRPTSLGDTGLAEGLRRGPEHGHLPTLQVILMLTEKCHEQQQSMAEAERLRVLLGQLEQALMGYLSFLLRLTTYLPVIMGSYVCITVLISLSPRSSQSSSNKGCVS